MDSHLENNSGRRKFIKSLGAIGTLCMLPDAVIPKNSSCNERYATPVLKCGPYLQFFKEGEMTIRWITKVPCYCWIEYGNSMDKTDQKADVATDGLVDAYKTVHAVTLQCPKPDNVYYRICSQKISRFDPYEIVYGTTHRSQVFSFNPLYEHSCKVSFLVLNDIHDRPESFNHLLKLQTTGRKDFLLLNGDIFSHIENEDQLIGHLFLPLSELSSGTPIVLSRGNHETRGKFARRLSDYFNRHSHGFYYSFIAGPAYCIVLDSGEDKPDDDPEYFGLVRFDPYRLAQREWLMNEINKDAFKKARYRIVFSHIPPFYSGDWHGTLHCRAMWVDILNKAGIDAYISGHTHKYGIHAPVEDLHNFPIIIGGGPRDGFRTLIEVHADESTLQILLKDDAGKLQGELKI